ncbi:MAG: ABC transporter ATP-binding protein [Candidatus Limimorpha sp.]
MASEFDISNDEKDDIVGQQLKVRNMRVSFLRDGEWFEAVHGIDFDVPKGKTLGIVGESGSGKSVSSLALMRLLDKRCSRVEADAVILGGQDILNIDEKAMRDIRGRRVAMIFQEPMTSLNPLYKCGFQVVEAVMAHGRIGEEEARQRVVDLFNKVMLPRPEKIFDSYPHQLSGGQKQRVMIAMALACNPELLIADEPTTALDVTVQKEILRLLRQLQREISGMSMIFISHDLAVVSEISDYIAVMHNGYIVEYGDAKSVLENPRDPYTKGLMACRPPLDCRLKRLPTVKEFVDGVWDDSVDFKDELLVTGEERARHLQELYRQQPLLSVRGLKTWFPSRKGLFNRVTDNVKAVDDVSFEVFPGETLGLVGESGCGKTTLGRSLLRLEDNASGVVLFEGKDVMSLRGKELRDFHRNAQIVFQDPYSSLNPKMRVGDAIAEPLLAHGIVTDADERRETVCGILEAVGMKASDYQKYPHEFSGGQRQRICIARTLVLRPKLVICDESVSALDVSVQAQVLNLLNSLKKELGFTIIFISHDLSVVRFMSDRILVMYGGKMVELGDADEVFVTPKNDYTRRLINAIPKINEDNKRDI